MSSNLDFSFFALGDLRGIFCIKPVIFDQLPTPSIHFFKDYEYLRGVPAVPLSP
jgi:hypothetical protein